MKKLLVLLVICLATLSLPLAADAKDKMVVYIEMDTISIQVGNIQYVSDTVTPHVLKSVQVWNKPDSLRADENPYGITSFVNGVATPSDHSLKASEISARWTKRLKEFETLRQKIEVYVLKPVMPLPRKG